jgi:hypothetical protein
VMVEQRHAQQREGEQDEIDGDARERHGMSPAVVMDEAAAIIACGPNRALQTADGWTVSAVGTCLRDVPRASYRAAAPANLKFMHAAARPQRRAATSTHGD